jgi:hypothetical protein
MKERRISKWIIVNFSIMALRECVGAFEDTRIKTVPELPPEKGENGRRSQKALLMRTIKKPIAEKVLKI